jgi:hypothetical protein
MDRMKFAWRLRTLSYMTATTGDKNIRELKFEKGIDACE